MPLKKNLSGKTFGELTVLNESQSKNSRGVIWECECSCGQITKVNSSTLLSGNTKSCGCARKIRKKKASFNALYGSYERQAHLRGHIFNLSKETFESITSQPCDYCGSLPVRLFFNGLKNKGGEFYPYNGIDRKDNNLGYVLDNCVPCCSICNRAKLNLPLQEFNTWIQRIKSHVR